MKKLFVLFLISSMIFTMGAVILCFAAEDGGASSVADQMEPTDPKTTPLYNEDGEEIAFEVGENTASNSTTAIVLMVGFIAICLLLCLDGIFSFIRKSRKRREEMFDADKINRE